MNLNFLFFELGPALQLIFKINYIPRRKDFKELTPNQYQAFNAKASKEDIEAMRNKKIFTFAPDDSVINERLSAVMGKEMSILSEDELAIFQKTSEFIDHFADISGREDLDTLPKKLEYIASLLPEVYSKGTPYYTGERKENK